MSLDTLKCQPMEGRSALDHDEIARHCKALPMWAVEGGALKRRFEFPDYHRTMAFVNAVAWIAHQQDHHPDLEVAWGSCIVRFSTHAVGGLSINDFICARQVDRLLQ